MLIKVPDISTAQSAFGCLDSVRSICSRTRCMLLKMAVQLWIFCLEGSGFTMRLGMKMSVSVLAVAIAAITFARWKESPLHIRVCGPNSSSNLRWLLYGSRANDNWSAKLCGCVVPDVFAEGIRRGFDSNPGALIIERELSRNKEFRKRFDQLGFGKTPK